MASLLTHVSAPLALIGWVGGFKARVRQSGLASGGKGNRHGNDKGNPGVEKSWGPAQFWCRTFQVSFKDMCESFPQESRALENLLRLQTGDVFPQ